MSTIANLSVLVGADISELQNKLGQADGEVKGFGGRVSGALNAAKSAIVPMAGAIAAIGGASLAAAVNFEANFANVVKTVDGTKEELDALKGSIRDMATVGNLSALDNAHDTLTNIAAIAGQLGVPTQDIQEFTQVVGGMTVATDLSGEAAATFMARFANITGMPIEDVDNFADALVTLGNNSAANESDIANVANRLSTLSTLGFEPAEILGMSAAVASLGISAELGGTNISKVIAEMTAAAAEGGEPLRNFAAAAGMSADEFKALQASDPAAAFDALISSLSGMSETEILSTLQSIGVTGVEQQQVLMKLAGGYDTVKSSMETANEAFEGNGALMTEVAAKADTTAGKFNTFKNNVTDLAIQIGDALLPAASAMAVGFTKMVRGIKDGDLEGTLQGLGDAFQPIVDGLGLDIDVGAGLVAWIDAFQNLKTIVAIITDDIRRRFSIMKLDIEIAANDMFISIQKAVPEQIRDNDALFAAEDQVVSLASERQGFETADRLNDTIRQGLQSGQPLTLNDLVDMGEGLTIPMGDLLGALDTENTSELLRQNLQDMFTQALSVGDDETVGGLMSIKDLINFDPMEAQDAIKEAMAAATAAGDEDAMATIIDVASEMNVDIDEEKFRTDVKDTLESHQIQATVQAGVSIQAIITEVATSFGNAFGGGSGSPGGGTVPTFHSGGVFRSGSGEGLAMLRDGERVLTPGQSSGYGGGGGVVINYSSFGETPYNAMKKIKSAASDAGY